MIECSHKNIKIELSLVEHDSKLIHNIFKDEEKIKQIEEMGVENVEFSRPF